MHPLRGMYTYAGVGGALADRKLDTIETIECV